jgi:hypothetical protein
MKKHIKKFGFILMIVLLFSCNDFGEINVNPVRSTNLDPVNQLVYTQMRYSGDYTDQLRLAIGVTMPLLQQIAGTFTNNSGATYAYSESVYSLVWGSNYPGVVVNIVDAVERTRGVANKTNLNAMCRIMRVMVFARLTDLYGDIPYSEAGQGYISLTMRPKYDDQKDIYNDFFKELKEAFTQLDATKDKVNDDQFYGGDVAKWKKLANSLRLRYAMRLVKVDPAKSKTEAEAAFADGLIASNADICMTKHEDVISVGTEYRGNGLTGGLYAQPDPSRITTTMINLMKPATITDLVDPRLNILTRSYYPLLPLVTGPALQTRIDITDPVAAYYAAVPGNNAMSGIFGIAPGAASLSNNPAVLSITIDVPGKGKVAVAHKDQRRQVANFLQQYHAPAIHVSYSEVALLCAEAKVRGWNVGSDVANTLYQNGIKAHIEQLKLYPGAPAISGYDVFIASKNLATGKELEQINSQLYLTLFLNPLEGFSNWRRSGFPNLLPVGVVGLSIPRRFQYPQNEIDQNKENMMVAVAKIQGIKGSGADSFLNRVWWDKE